MLCDELCHEYSSHERALMVGSRSGYQYLRLTTGQYMHNHCKRIIKVQA